jgi:cytochrome c oxidase assembly factor CtaG
MVGASAVGWLLSLVLAFAPSALYPVYAHMVSRPGGISALTDQQLAAGMMLGPGSVPMMLFVFFGLYRWLGNEEDSSGPALAARRRSTAGSA